VTWWCSATGEAWSWTWRAYPGVWLMVAVLAFGYWRLTRRPAGERPGPERPWLGWAGVLIIWLMLDWPVGTLGAGYLVSVHAAQFLILAFIAPPLLLLGIPAGRWALLARRLGRGGPLAAVVRTVTHPVVAGVAFNLVVLVTHLPDVVDTLMTQQAGAFVVDLAWILVGILFWWPIVAPVPARRGGVPASILNLFLATVIHTALAMWLLLSRYPVYGVYELAPPIGGRSAMADQAMAGGIMELVGGGLIIGAIAVLFFRWAAMEERRS
jgi:putative membrane protein